MTWLVNLGRRVLTGCLWCHFLFCDDLPELNMPSHVCKCGFGGGVLGPWSQSSLRNRLMQTVIYNQLEWVNGYCVRVDSQWGHPTILWLNAERDLICLASLFCYLPNTANFCSWVIYRNLVRTSLSWNAMSTLTAGEMRSYLHWCRPKSHLSPVRDRLCERQWVSFIRGDMGNVVGTLGKGGEEWGVVFLWAVRQAIQHLWCFIKDQHRKFGMWKMPSWRLRLENDVIAGGQ